MHPAITDNPLIAGLMLPQAYQHKTGAIQVIETHISWVLLTGDFAYKIKKPVNFGFLDFSTLEKRHFYCQEELRLNRRFSSELYLDVVPITGTPSEPGMDGPGTAIEYAVKMRQFETGSLLSERAEHGLLGNEDIDGIARTVGAFHQSATVAEADSPYGDPLTIKDWCEENFDHILPLLQDDSELQRAQRLQSWMAAEWQQKAWLMHRRKQQGYVRECHGDLHLGNIALIHDKITPFDCIEFNPMLRWIDVISEMAFVLMDLAYRELEAFAWRLLNAYLQKTGDYQGLSLLRYYLVYRALVRAKVTLLSRHQEADAVERQRIHSEYTKHAALAERHTRQTKPVLIITHGFSGSGKSFHAKRLAEEVGAVHLRSDIERKRLFGFAALDDTNSAAGSGIYTAQAGDQTYRHLAGIAGTVLRAGYKVIVDATFLKHAQRALFQELAESLSTPLMILDFSASAAVLSQRIERRRQQQNDASEATAEILQQQIARAEALSEAESKHTISIDTGQQDAHAELLGAIASYMT